MSQLKIDLNNGILEVEGEESLVKEIYEDFKKQLSSRTFNAPVIPENKTNIVKFTNNESCNLSNYQTLGDIFAAIPVALSTDVQKVLVAASFLQEKNSLGKITGQEIGKELKHIGQGVNNITHAISGNIDVKPQRMIQLKKSGKTKQAKKDYKVTVAGINAVKNLISNGEWKDSE